METTLGLVLFSKQDTYAALRHLEHALAIAPRYDRAYYIQGLTLLQAGQPEQAFAAFNNALRIRGTHPDALEGIGTTFYQQGNYRDAVVTMQKALAQKPHSPDFKNNLAWLLSTCPEPSLRNGTRAIMLAREATASSQKPNTSFLDTLAAAYAEAEDFDKATDTIREALDIARSNGNYQFIPILESRLKLYENRMPYEQAPPDKKP
jgi:Flp pilus assembly protein TadD